MISNTRLLKLLTIASRVFDSRVAAFFCALIASTYRFVLIPALSRLLRRHMRDHGAIRLLGRQSVQRRADFNPVMSDLDLTAVMETESPEATNQLRRFFQTAKRMIPFLGELEIYTEQEYAELNEWLRQATPIYSTLRDIRKIGWMEHAYVHAPSEYHRTKAMRSMSKSLERLNSSQRAHAMDNSSALAEVVMRLIEQRFPDIIQGVDGTISSGRTIACSYLGRSIAMGTGSSQGACAALSLILPVPHALVLLALMPGGDRNVPELDLEIKRLRSSTRIGKVWHCLAEAERIIIRGVAREANHDPEWVVAWGDILENSCLEARSLKHEPR